MSEFSFYDIETGLFSNRHFSGDAAFLAVNTPPGFVAVPGIIDPATKKADPATGIITDYRPSAPGPYYTWNDAQRRWIDTGAENLLALKEKIRLIEREEQARALREHALNLPGATARLQAFDDKIAAFRAEIVAINNSRP